MRKRTTFKLYTAMYILAVFVGFLILIGGIWVADGIWRLFRKPQALLIVDARIAAVTEEYPASEENPVSDGMQGTNYSPTWDIGGNLRIRKADVGIPQGFMTIQKAPDSIHTGCLLRLDATHAPAGAEATEYTDMTDFMNKTDTYRLKDMQLQVQASVVDAMNEMTQAYYAFSGRADFLVYSTTEICTAQGSLYPEYLPDRYTGYCVDLAFLNTDGSISAITEENNGWLKENAHRFGFIFSYTQENQQETGIMPAPYHLRYVGKVHACLMHDTGLCLEAYLDALTCYTAENYYFYEACHAAVYYVKAKTDGITNIPIPEGKTYVISGNNTDGYIICAEDIYA